MVYPITKDGGWVGSYNKNLAYSTVLTRFCSANNTFRVLLKVVIDKNKDLSCRIINMSGIKKLLSTFVISFLWSSNQELRCGHYNIQPTN